MMKLRAQPLLLLFTDLEGYGGIARFNQNLMKSLGKYKLEILVLNGPDGLGFRGFSGNKTLFLFFAIRALTRYPKVVVFGHLHFVPLALVSYLIGVYSITVLHGIEAWKTRRIDSIFLRFVNSFWAVSTYTLKKFLANGLVERNDVKLIHNTVETNWAENNDTKRKGHSFLSVARLDEREQYKGIDVTIRALQPIKSILLANNWKYKIVAYGSDLVRHQHLAETLGLDDVVQFYSEITDKDLKMQYESCDFFILPSSGEGFGIVFLEAMVYGKAVIGGAGCGTEDVIVDGKTGFLVEQNEEAICDKIVYLIENTKECLELGRNGYHRVHKHFSQDKFDSLIEKLINECVE